MPRYLDLHPLPNPDLILKAAPILAGSTLGLQIANKQKVVLAAVRDLFRENNISDPESQELFAWLDQTTTERGIQKRSAHFFMQKLLEREAAILDRRNTDKNS